MKEAKAVGKNAFLCFKGSNSPDTVIPIIHSYVNFLGWAPEIFIDSSERKQIEEELVPFVTGAISELADKTNESLLKSLGYETAGRMAIDFRGDWIGGAAFLEKLLQNQRR